MEMSDYYRTLSLTLSRVMDDIGVGKEVVMRRRRARLMVENSYTLLSNTALQRNHTNHIFGSQTEGTTTPGLQSDVDLLLVLEDVNVINDWSDWVAGKANLLMVHDDVLHPGYCKLQALRDDMPLAVDSLPDDRFMFDEKRRVLVKSTLFAPDPIYGLLSRGPAINLVEPGDNNDLVCAFPVQTLSNHYKEWTSRQRPSNWPSLDMIEYIANMRSFVVPYVHDDNERPNIDWRISTSLAERFLMFSLNITQIRCYVLLKMIVKTFIEPHVPDVISSYICKTVLFHSLERTRRDFWIEPNLVQCVIYVLLYMLAAVHTKDCPNYFNESSNLFFGKIDDEVQEQLMTRIREVVKSDGRFLLKISFDDLNCRLTRYIRDRNLMLSFDANEIEKTQILVKHTLVLCVSVGSTYLKFLLNFERTEISRECILPTIMNFFKHGGLQRRAGFLMLPFICSFLATVDACECILQGQNITSRALQLYRLSLRSDAVWSKLKYASFLYCTGQFQGVLSVIQHLERSLKQKTVHVCPCTKNVRYITEAFYEEERQNPYPSTYNADFCVMFARAEFQCCPRELQFEFYRSTKEDQLHRHIFRDRWMDTAVLECLPYLYYLQYMTARHLRRQDLQYRALQKFESLVCSEEVLGHRETAYNILGQCWELENNVDRALMYYGMSLQVRPRNNAAKWHVARLCFEVFMRKNEGNE